VVRRSGRVLGVGSVVPEDPGWRVRGMATEPAARGRGVGAEILAALIEHARAHGATLIWCNARPAAMSLYERAGFVAVGEPWDDPELGPHQRMELEV
jgi:GNAT superfamily N-acetyltransferase